MKTTTIHKAMRAVAAVLAATCMSLPSHADGFAPREVHGTIWQGLFAPHSPETVAMVTHGDGRHDLHSGSASMSIPVYSWKDNLFEIPVSLGYSYSGLKPGFTSSTVGLGWYLNAGGVITREVRGIPDETWDAGFFGAASHLRSMYLATENTPGEGSEEPSGSADNPQSNVFTDPGSPYGGRGIRGFASLYGGYFSGDALSPSTAEPMLVYTGGLGSEFMVGMRLADDVGHHCVETEPDLFRFSFMGNSGSFVLQPDHGVLILESEGPAGELDIEFHCPRGCEGNGSWFSVTTGEGVRYMFAAQAYSKSVELLSGSDQGGDSDTWSSWRLTEILHPSGHRVTFEYDDEVVSNYSAAKSRDHLTLTATQPDGTPEGLGTGRLPQDNWQDPESYSEDALTLSEVHDKRLRRITVEGRGHIDFDYSDGMLSRIQAWTLGFPGIDARLLAEASLAHSRPASPAGAQGLSGVRFLKSVYISGEGTWQFTYDGEGDASFPSLMDADALHHVDWYGYYSASSYAPAYSNASLDILQLSQAVLSARGAHDPILARLGAMTRVTHPTGGWSEIEYEGNDHSRTSVPGSVPSAHATVTGGVRVRSVALHDQDGSVLSERRYSYEMEDGSSSGVLLQPIGLADIHHAYTFDNRHGLLGMRVHREACSPQLGLGYSPERHVEYLRVVEDVYGGGERIASTEHRFHSASTVVDEGSTACPEVLTQSEDHEASLSSVFEMVDAAAPLPDWRMAGTSALAGREWLTVERSLGPDCSALETETVRSTYSLDGSPSSFVGLTLLGGSLYDRTYTPRLTYVQSTTTTVTESDGSAYSSSTSATVNGLGQLASVIAPASDGSVLRTSYSYHPGSPALVTSVTVTRDEATVSRVEMAYMPLDGAHPGCLVPFQLIERAVGPDGSLSVGRAKATMGGYDSWCNPGTVTDAAGRARSWSWGYGGLHPVSMSLSDGACTRTTWWEWIPMVGVSRATDPSGRSTSYGYDGFGRLVSMSDPDGNVVAENMYNIVSLPCEGAHPFTSSLNYVASLSHRDSGVTATDVTYHDGLGRARQAVSVTPDQGAYAVQSEVDALGRVTARSLPFAHPTIGGHVPGWSASLRSQYAGFGDGAESLWTRTVFERRATGRELCSTIPGESFSSHPSSRTYRSNADGEVALYACSPVDWSVSCSGSYPAGSLQGVESTDGDGRSVVEWTDREGRTVCTTRRGGGADASTYYVHDFRGLLAWVISPEGVGETVGGRTSVDDDAARAWCDVYTYDDWGRMTSRRLAGKESERFVYDSADRVVLRDDGNLRADRRWLHDTYDAFDELTGSSIVTKDLTRDQLQARFPAEGLPVPGATSLGVGMVLSRTEYGDPGSGALPFEDEPGVVSGSDLGSSDNLKSREVLAVLPFTQNVSTLPGRPIIDDILDPEPFVPNGDGQGSSRLSGLERRDTTYFHGTVDRTYYYDRCGRVAQLAERNHLGGVSRTSWRYDWAGNVLECVERHSTSAGSSSEDVKRSRFTYDARGRVLSEEVQVNGGETAYVEHSYDALGREVGSQLGDSEYGISCGRSYTLQGWLCGLEYRDYADGDVFAESLRYADAPDFGVPSYSGKVSGLSFVHRWHPEQEVAFSYDGMGRLLGSSREDGVSRFTEQGISYDLNGNVLSIRRYGANDATPEDDFALSYVGNALSGLVSSDGTCRSFSHDSNGNMTFDGLRGLTIGYNCLNLPETTSESGMRRATYSYCSDGTKVQAADSLGAGHAYLGSMVYALDGAGCSLESAGFSVGRIVAAGASTSVRYHLTDHLGSVRSVAHGEEGEGAVVHEQSDYYPFGLRMDDGLAEATSPANRWRFAGKEDQPLLGPGVQDFGARFYDSRLCRWTTQDPLAEKYPGLSPYCYCGGDPVGRVDPDGREVRPRSEAALNVIRNTLPLEAREYVQLNSDGLIDKTILSQYSGKSKNYSSLCELVDDTHMLTLTLSENFEYKDKNGIVSSGMLTYCSVDEYFYDINVEYTSGLSTGETGSYAKTLFPDNVGLQNSPSSDIEIYIHPSMSALGSAEAFSHEGYGHALMYIRSGGDHNAASHSFGENNVDMNNVLSEQIKSSRRETICNFGH